MIYNMFFKRIIDVQQEIHLILSKYNLSISDCYTSFDMDESDLVRLMYLIKMRNYYFQEELAIIKDNANTLKNVVFLDEYRKNNFTPQK